MKLSIQLPIAIAATAMSALAAANVTYSAFPKGKPTSLTEKNNKITLEAIKPTELTNTTLAYQFALLEFNLNTFGLKDTKQWWTTTQAASFDGTIDVQKYSAQILGGANSIRGGLEVNFTYTPGKTNTPTEIKGAKTGPNGTISNKTNINGNAVWTQDIFTNVPGSDVTAFNKSGQGLYLTPYPDISFATDADHNGQFVLGDNAKFGPIYPYERNGSSFYDFPKRSGIAGTTVFWQADDFLVSPNLATHTLTVYDGVQYGFNITMNPAAGGAPGPAPFVAFGGGLLGMVTRRRRR